MRAFSINASNINVCNIDVKSIHADDINAQDIRTKTMYAQDINARSISALRIRAKNIYYQTCCYTMSDLICDGIKGSHSESKHWSFSGKVIINGKEQPQ